MASTAAPAPEATTAGGATAHSEKLLQQQEQQMQVQDGGSDGKKQQQKKSTLAAKLKGALFLAILIVVAALSTTVLRKPLMASADWLRARGEAGYAIIGAAGFAFLMVSGSSHLFDLVCGFFCGPLPGACVCVGLTLPGRAAAGRPRRRRPIPALP